jgi:hypothetical protein
MSARRPLGASSNDGSGDASTAPVVPQWWMPEDMASFSLTAPIVSAGAF